MWDDYPRFAPPDDLDEKGRKDWTLAEARRYRDWLLGALETRTAELHERLALPADPDPRRHLEELGRRLVAALPGDALSQATEDERSLTTLGYSVAADAGLTVAQLLLASDPDMGWTIVRKPKSDASYNLPVLTGFHAWRVVDPVEVSIADANGVLMGLRDETAWRDLYDRVAELRDA